MDAVITPSINVYRLCTTRLKSLLEEVDDEVARSRIKEDLNPIIWIAGHMATYRCKLAHALGRPVDHGWGDRFDRGTEVSDPRPFPPIGEVLTVWVKATEVLEKRFEELAEDELSAPAPRDFPFPDKTLRGMICFLSYHESYHLGQIGFLKKWVTRS